MGRLPGHPPKLGEVDPKTDAKFGTTTFGNIMHKAIVDWLNSQYPDTEFRLRLGRGQTGIDIEYVSGTKPSFIRGDKAEIKPLSASGQRSFADQIRNWNLDRSDTIDAITYDAWGNIYHGFGSGF
jgi:hypothetical protein